MMRDFLDFDKIIGNDDIEQEAVEQFNELRRIRPDLLRHPELVRSVLRSVIEQSGRIDKLTLQELIDEAPSVDVLIGSKESSERESNE